LRRIRATQQVENREIHMVKSRYLASAVVAGSALVGMASGALAQNEVAEFYKGKTITMLIGSGAGGGYDVYARLLARHMGKHIPGNPNFISQNKVGAASIVATNFLVNVAPRDGTIVGSLQRQVALLQFMGRKGLKFESDKLNWLGSLAKEAGVCALATRTGVKSFDVVFRTQFSMGSTGATASEQWPALFNSLMAARFKLIKGYPSTPQIHLAIQRGELDGICQSWASFSEQGAAMLKDGSIKPVVQMTFHPDREMTRLGVPMLEEFLTTDRMAKGQTVADVRLFFELTLLPQIMGRPFAVAPGVPKARVEALRAAFSATTKDPGFIADAKKLGRDIEVLGGAEIQDLVARIAKTP
jgi:tripartite-type tricarboxylate transporter receptor subunit TctC